MTEVVEIDIDDDRVAGYAFYENDLLVRAILINSQAYFANQNAARGSVHVDLAIDGLSKSRTMTIKRLSIGYELTFLYRL